MSQRQTDIVRRDLMVQLKNTLQFSSNDQLIKLGHVLETYARKFPNTYTKHRDASKNAFLADLLVAIEEATDTRIDC